MPHIRQQVRDAVKGLLAGLPTTQERVFTGRSRKLPSGSKPTLLIFTPRESVEVLTQDFPRRLRRRQIVAVHGVVSADAPPDDTLDTIAAEVEAVLADATARGKLLKDTHLLQTDTTVQAEGESHIGGITLQYQVTIVHLETAAS